MDNYMMFFGFCMFVIGAVVGRVTMAVQYEVMKKSIGQNKIEERPKKSIKKPEKLEYKLNNDSGKKEFCEYMMKK